MFDELIGPMLDSVDTAGVAVERREVPGPDGATPVPVVVHTPDGDVPDGGRPALLSIHGGGFVMGTAAMELAFAVQLARELGAVVVAPEYRLAPEHPFPAGLEDCYAVLRWMADDARALGIDATRLAVGGQSAGGGLDRGGGAPGPGPRRSGDLLPVPRHPRARPPAPDHEHAHLRGHAAVEPPGRRAQLGRLPRRRGRDRYASPSIAEDLGGLPPAYVSTMEFDPLRDEGILYALRLMEAGVSRRAPHVPGHLPRLGARAGRSGVPPGGRRGAGRAGPRPRRHDDGSKMTLMQSAERAATAA